MDSQWIIVFNVLDFSLYFIYRWSDPKLNSELTSSSSSFHENVAYERGFVYEEGTCWFITLCVSTSEKTLIHISISAFFVLLKKKMVSNTESMNANQFMSSSNSTGAGAIGRLRQTLQQAHESVSTRLQQNRSGSIFVPTDQPGIDTPGGTDNLQNVTQTPVEEKENQEVA